MREVLLERTPRDGGGALETQLCKKSGEIFPAHLSLTLLRDEAGLEIGVAGYVLDITERKQIENALREREASLAFAQRVAHLGSWEWHLESGRLQWSDEVYRIWGFTPGAFTPSYEKFIDSIYPEDRELVEKFITAALQNEVLFSIDHRIVLPDGGVRFVHEEARLFRDEAGKALNVAGTVQDITEHKQAEQEIRASREQLRELSNHLQTVREEEKAMIAREIHDELGGNLTALKMDIFWLERKLPLELEAAREKVASMSDVVDASVHAMRRVVTELRPTVLDDLGLLAAMQWQASEFTKRYNIQCKVSTHGEEIALAEEIRIALFRIFQEALTNVARYSKASLVRVDVWREHDKIALEVFDNGIGIPEGAIMQPTSHGLRGMMERARSLGGSAEIGSAPGEGVAISVRIPLPVAVEEEV
jgi:PAS domain S-box-containing protein